MLLPAIVLNVKFVIVNGGTCNCSQTTANVALDLINRQQDEIDSLRADFKRVCAERDAHICTNNFIKSEAYLK